MMLAEEAGEPKPPLSVGFTYELCAGIVDKKKSLAQIAAEEVRAQLLLDCPLPLSSLVSLPPSPCSFPQSSSTSFTSSTSSSPSSSSSNSACFAFPLLFLLLLLPFLSSFFPPLVGISTQTACCACILFKACKQLETALCDQHCCGQCLLPYCPRAQGFGPEKLA